MKLIRWRGVARDIFPRGTRRPVPLLDRRLHPRRRAQRAGGSTPKPNFGLGIPRIRADSTVPSSQSRVVSISARGASPSAAAGPAPSLLLVMPPPPVPSAADRRLRSSVNCPRTSRLEAPRPTPAPPAHHLLRGQRPSGRHRGLLPTARGSTRRGPLAYHDHSSPLLRLRLRRRRRLRL